MATANDDPRVASVRCALSGDVLATFPVAALVDMQPRAVKQNLSSRYVEFSEYRIRLVQNSHSMGDQEPFALDEQGNPHPITVVIIPLRTPSATELKHLIKYLTQGNNMAVQMLLDRGLDVAPLVHDRGGKLRNLVTLALMSEWKTRATLARDRTWPPITRQLLEAHGNVNITDAAEATPFAIAVSLGWTEAMDLLLHYGANVNEMSRLQETGLHYAVRHGALDTVKHLLRCRADPHVRSTRATWRGETVFEVAERLGQFSVLAILQDQSTGRPVLHLHG
eukprot:s1098_g3.t1